MTEKKGWGTTVLGWFVETDAARPDASVPSDDDAIIAAAAAQHATTPQIFTADTPPPPPAAGGEVDFGAVFAAANIAEEDQERVAKAAELLKSLPAGTDPVVRKQIVEASLKAFGVPIPSIIEAGVGEIQALEAYIRVGASETQKAIDAATMKVQQFEEEIARIRASMQQRVEEQKGVVQRCNDRKLQVQQILEFFGQEAVAQVVRDSPKLHEPSATA